MRKEHENRQKSMQLWNSEISKKCYSAIPKMQQLTIAQLKVIVNTTCGINSAMLIEQIEKVQHSSCVRLNNTILK